MGLRFRKALSNWAFVSTLLTACAAVILAFQFDATYTVDVGGYYDRVYLRDFHRPEVGQGEDWFRWTEGAGTIRLPGLGARGCWLSLRMQGWRPAEASPARLSLLVNGHLLWRGGVGRDWQEYRFWVAPGLVRGGTLRLTLQSDTFVPVEQGVGGDNRTLGVAVTQVTVGTPRASFALGWPAFDQLGWVLLFAVALYLSLSSLLMSPRWAAIVSALASAGLGWALAARRLWTAIYTPRLAIVTALGLLLLPALRWIFGRVFAWGQVAAEEKDLRLLLAVFLIGFLLKAGGLLYPFSVAIDLKWHLEKAQQVVQGGLADLYRPGALASWITPQGMGSGGESAIPYSPFYHITAAAFFFLPWPPYATANVLSVLLDTTRCFLVYFLTCRLGLGRRTGLLAGLLYAAMPATFLLHSWGNVPTTTGLWWCLAATCYLIGGWERLGKVRTWAGLVFFLLGAMLYYSVTAVLGAS